MANDTRSRTLAADGDRRQPVRFGLKLSYSAGSLVDGVASNAVLLFLLFYLTAVCGMPGGLAGIALSAGLMVDAVADPLLGAVSDTWRSRWGRRLPFMAAGAVPAALSFIAIFSIPHLLHGAALFWAVTALSILLRVSVSLFNLPYLAFGAEITDDYVERSRITAWRWAISMAGPLACIVLGFGIFFKGPEGLMRGAAYGPFAVASTVLIALGAVAAILATYTLRGRGHTVAEGRVPAARMVADLGEVFRNPSFRILFASALLFFTAQAVAQGAGLHANTFFWRLPASAVQLVTFATFAGLLLGGPLLTPFVVRVEKRTALFWGLGGLVAAQAGPTTVRLMGGLMLPPGPLTLVLTANAFLGGAFLAMAAIAFGSMMADAADEHEYLFDKRREGLYFAGWAFAAKAANGLGALIAGGALQLIGFPQDLAAKGGLHAVIAPEVVWRLGLVVGPAAGALSLAGVLVFIAYRLDAAKHAGILAALKARRGD